jgi:tetratricopeptide (TPR) repeat protein
MLLRQSRAREAMTQLSQMLRTTRPGSGVVMLYVRAALAAGDFRAADTAIAEALRQSPDSPELTAARGLVQLARGQIDEGLAALQRASDARPHDVSLRIELGEAALRVGRLAVASQAFRRVLEASPTSVSAHIGLARVAMDEARFADAESAIVAAEQHGAPPLEVARLRAALSVARGLGASGVPAVREALERLGRDPLLNASMGELQLQAEEEREAESSFGRALNQDRDLPEALLGRAMLEIGRSRLGPATRLLDRGDRAARERGRPASMLARLQVARGWVSFDRLHLDEAQQLAERALQLDPRCGDAHWLLANIALERRNDPTPHLRAASLGTRTPPEALAQLAIRLRSGNEACDIARRYVAAAPHGYDRRNVEEVLRRCR